MERQTVNAKTRVSARRIWSEHVPFDVLRRRVVLESLSRRTIQLIVAVQPTSLPELTALLEDCGEAGVDVGLWPLLEDRLGRWPSDVNVEAFREHLLRLLDVIDSTSSRPMEVVFDLEPPIAMTRRLLELRVWDGRVRLRPADLDMAVGQFAALAGEVRSRGIQPTAVVAPMVLYDRTAGAGGWQRLLGTPVEGVGFDRITVMAYTSLFQGYSRGALSRRDARSLLALICERARKRWPGRSAIALGVVGGGALGDEVPYKDLAELEDDVAIARAAGVDDLALFGLTGVLCRSPSPERWLDVFIETMPASTVPTTTARAGALDLCTVAAGRCFEAFFRRLPMESR